METNSARDELEILLHMAEPEIRIFLRLLEANAVYFPNTRGLTPAQKRKLRIVLCEDWLRRYEELDDALTRELHADEQLP